MPTTYTGSLSGITPHQDADISEPVGSDPPNAATFAVPFERLTNLIHYLMKKAGISDDPDLQYWLGPHRFEGSTPTDPSIIVLGENNVALRVEGGGSAGAVEVVQGAVGFPSVKLVGHASGSMPQLRVEQTNASTAAERRTGVELVGGDLVFADAVNPAPQAVGGNAIRPSNTPKCWGNASVTSGVPTLHAGYNVSTDPAISLNGGALEVRMAHAMASDKYAVACNVYMAGAWSYFANALPVSSQVFRIQVYDASGSGTNVNLSGLNAAHISWMVFALYA